MSHQSQSPVGVLLMAYGGPESLEEIPGYLADIRSGRPTTPAVLDEITNNYRQIGGKSPLLAWSTRQTEAVSNSLNPNGGDRYQVYLGMRHWSPWIEDTVRQMLDDGIERAVSLVLAPHYSKLSIAKYQAKIEAGLAMFHGDIAFAHIDSYHNAPGLIQALANRVRTGLEEWPESERDNVHVIFSAHSLPVRIIKSGDPYDDQLRETAQLVAEAAELSPHQWSWSYQSAGKSPEPWLGPQLEDHLVDLAGQGIKNVVSVPVGFVCDHVEILYDIDIEAQHVAQKHGIRLVRPPALNTDPLFINELARQIEHAAASAGWITVRS
jgi:ferrochelatase